MSEKPFTRSQIRQELQTIISAYAPMLDLGRAEHVGLLEDLRVLTGRV